MAPIHVTNVTFKPAPPHSRGGLLGWIGFAVNRTLVVSAAIRRTRAGRLAIAYPSHRSPTGFRHFYSRPVDDYARREIERQVFAALRLEVAP